MLPPEEKGVVTPLSLGGGEVTLSSLVEGLSRTGRG